MTYLRVSSVDQNVDRQVEAVGQVDKIFADRISREERRALSEMIAYMREGDTIRVVAMDRLGRSVLELPQIVQQCTTKGLSIERTPPEHPRAQTPFARTPMRSS